MHWYVYHSQKVMGHSYASLGKSVVYSTKRQPKLCLGHVIWVIEGDSSTPKRFSLADCFKVTETDIPPFPIGYGDFQLKASAPTSMLRGQLQLDGESAWFKELHGRYIRKQCFFQNIADESTILAGLMAAAGIALE